MRESKATAVMTVKDDSFYKEGFCFASGNWANQFQRYYYKGSRKNITASDGSKSKVIDSATLRRNSR